MQLRFKPWRVSMFLVLGALALASPVSAGTDSDEQEASVTLLRPDPNVGNIHGSVEIGTKTSEASEKFKVEVEDADLPGDHDLYIESATEPGTMIFDQTLPADGDGFKLELDTSDGETLPGGANTTQELAGRRVEIRAGLQVVLAGTIPEYSEFEAELKGEAPLTRPATAAPDSDAKGEVEIRSEPHKGRERLKVEIEHVDSQLVHELYMEDPKGSGTMQPVGDFSFDGSEDGDDELEFELDTQDGVSLPFGLLTSEGLVGRLVDVRAAGAVVLQGTIPGFMALKKKQKSETLLVRPDPAPDADAKGKMKLKSEPFKGHDELKIEIKNVDSSVTHDVYMEDAVGSTVMALVGTMQADGSNELKFELDTKNGDLLPFGATINADLADRRVEIQANGQVVLFGTVPAVNAAKQTQKGATFVVRPDSSPDDDAVASMKLKTEVHKGRERFEVTVKKADTAVVHNLYLEDGAGSGVMVLVGPLAVHGKKLRYRIDTKVGQGLPLATASNTFLDGRRVEIRLGDGTVVLQGKVPSVTSGKHAQKNRKALTKLAAAGASPNPMVNGKLKLTSRPSKGDERIEIAAKKLDFSGTDYHVFIEDAAGSGVYQDVGLLDHKGTSTKGRFRRQTKKGQSLPFGVNSVADLALRLFEVRDDAGAVYLDGTIPAVQ